MTGFVKPAITENAIAVVQRVGGNCGNATRTRAHPLERHQRAVPCARIRWPQADAVRIAAGKAALGI
ncbi:hypothetical protein [Methylobacterium mesophilicum]